MASGGVARQPSRALVINFNSLDTLAVTVDALVGDHIATVVVDNASDDGSAQYLQKESRVISVLNPVNLGAAAARNIGVAMGKGNILLLDSDIAYIPGSYVYLEDVLAKNHVDCVGFDPYCCTSDPSSVWQGVPDATTAVREGWIAYTQYGLFTERVFEFCRFDDAYGPGWGLEDDDLYLQMLSHGMRSKEVRWKYFHRRHSSIYALAQRGQSINYIDRSMHFEAKWGMAYVPGIGRLLSGLSREQLQVFELCFIARLPVDAVGEALRLSHSCVSSHVATIRNRLNSRSTCDGRQYVSPRQGGHKCSDVTIREER